MNFRTHLEIVVLDPQANGMTFIEAQAPDGARVALMLRVVEPLVLGGHLELALTGEPVAARPATSALRSRMAGAAGVTSRSASQVSATGAPASGNAVGAAASPGVAAASTPQGPSASGDASSLLLSTILGESPPSAASMERDVNDEMDALFGAPRKG